MCCQTKEAWENIAVTESVLACQSCQSASIVPLLRTTSVMSLTVSATFPQHPPLAQNFSLAVSLCGFFPFCINLLPHHHSLMLRITSVPCLTVSSFLHVCLMLCHCCPGKMHSLMLYVNQAPDKLLSTSCCFTYLLACLPYGSTVCLLANICVFVIKPCWFPVEVLHSVYVLCCFLWKSSDSGLFGQLQHSSILPST